MSVTETFIWVEAHLSLQLMDHNHLQRALDTDERILASVGQLIFSCFGITPSQVAVSMFTPVPLVQPSIIQSLKHMTFSEPGLFFVLSVQFLPPWLSGCLDDTVCFLLLLSNLMDQSRAVITEPAAHSVSIWKHGPWHCVVSAWQPSTGITVDDTWSGLVWQAERSGRQRQCLTTCITSHVTGAKISVWNTFQRRHVRSTYCVCTHPSEYR